jgi:hypothetical protein
MHVYTLLQHAYNYAGNASRLASPFLPQGRLPEREGEKGKLKIDFYDFQQV